MNDQNLPPAGISEMSDEVFWDIIDGARSNVHASEIKVRLFVSLAKLSRKDLVQFETKYLDKMSLALRYDLSCVFGLITGSYSDDVFSDFRENLVMQGKVNFERIIADPEALLDTYDNDWTFADEGFAKTPQQAYVYRFLDEFPTESYPWPEQLFGERIDCRNDDQVRVSFPKVWSFLQRRCDFESKYENDLTLRRISNLGPPRNRLRRAPTLIGDSASMILYKRSKELVEETIKLAESKLAARFGEHDCAKLLVNFEMLFALERAGLLRFYPDPDRVVDLKESYLAAWDADTKENGDEIDRHRSCIDKRFDDFHLIAAKAKLRSIEKHWVNTLQLVDVPTPSLSELSDGLVLEVHSVFGDLLVSIPTSWNSWISTAPSQVPVSTLTHKLLDGEEYVINECRFSVERVFFAQGKSLVSDEVDESDGPYLLIARICVAENIEVPDERYLVCGTVEALNPSFQGERDFVRGVTSFDTPGGIECTGLESHSPVGAGRSRTTQFRCKDLYYHQHSENTFLLLEIGSVEGNHIESPDKVLLEHILDSLRIGQDE